MSETEQIKEILPLRDFILQSVGDRVANNGEKGSYLSVFCPFHDNRNTPAMYVYDTHWRCEGCGKNGDIFTFYQEWRGVDFKTALLFLAEKANVKLPDMQQETERDEALAVAHEVFLGHKQTAIDYLQSRGINPDVAERWGVGFAPPNYQLPNVSDEVALSLGLIAQSKTGGYYAFLQNRVVIPLWSHNRLIGFSGRDITGKAKAKYLNNKFPKSQYIFTAPYGMDDHVTDLVTVEGVLDAMKLHEKGIWSNSILGTSLSQKQWDILYRLNSGEARFCLDGDDAGRKALLRIFKNKQFPPDRPLPKISVLPNGHDVLSYLVASGNDQLPEFITLVEYFSRWVASSDAPMERVREVQEVVGYLPTMTRELLVNKVAQKCGVSVAGVRESVMAKVQDPPTTASPVLQSNDSLELGLVLYLRQHPQLITKLEIKPSDFLAEVARQCFIDTAIEIDPFEVQPIASDQQAELIVLNNQDLLLGRW